MPSLNTVAYAWGEKFVRAGDNIVVSEMEHHSNIVPWQMLCERKGAEIRVLPFDDEGRLRTEPAAVAARRAHARRRRDAGVEYARHTARTARDYRCGACRGGDRRRGRMSGRRARGRGHAGAWIAISTHFRGIRLFAPTGIGVLYGKRALLEEMPPFLGGGDMVDTVTFAKTTYAPVPLKFEAGTANFSGAIALGEAVKFVQRFDPEEVERHEQALLRRATERLAAIDGLRIYGTAPGKCAIVSFNVEGVHPYDMGMILDKARHRRPYRTALRRAGDGPLRDDGHVPRFIRALQHAGRSRRVGRRGRTGRADAALRRGNYHNYHKRK